MRNKFSLQCSIHVDRKLYEVERIVDLFGVILHEAVPQALYGVDIHVVVTKLEIGFKVIFQVFRPV